MRPDIHIIVAAGLGACVYQAGGTWQLALVAAGSEAFMDIDHALEHAVQSHRPFSLKTFFGRYNSLDWPRMVFLLHSYECLLLSGALAWYLSLPVLWALALGLGVHLLLDEIGNRLPSSPARMSPWFYFFSFRLMHGFRTEAYLWPHREFYESDHYREAVRRGRRWAASRDWGEVKS